jgi:hypothetical protein
MSHAWQLIFIRAAHEADFEHFEEIVLPQGRRRGLNRRGRP